MRGKSDTVGTRFRGPQPADEAAAPVTFPPTVLDYDVDRYAFPSLVAAIFAVPALDRLGDGASYGRFRRETDQSTDFHKRFYASFGQVEPLYRQFVQDVIGGILGEPFCFQRVPTFRVHLPSNVAVGEFHTDADYHHPVGEVNFWVPLTNAWGSNTVWIERAPSEKEYAPAPPLAPGQLLMFDAVRWSHGNVVNETGATRVSFDFRCIPLSRYREVDARSVNTGQRLAIGEYFDVFG
jgi:hypothetical protein